MIITRHDWRITRTGGSYEENASWLNYPDSWRSVWTGVVNQPLPIRFQTLVEGVDIPFFTRQHGEGNRLRQETLSYRRRLVTAGFFIPTSLPLASAAVDDLPFRVARLGQNDADRWKAELLQRFKVSREATLGRNVTAYANAAAINYAVTLCDLMDEIQYHLLENTIDHGLTWSLWSTEEVLGAINDRMCRFNQLTGIIQQRATITFSNGQPDGNLPSDVMTIRRLVWREGSTRYPLTPIDKHTLDNGFPGWQSTAPGTPFSYVEEPLLRGVVKLYPTPLNAGSVEIIYLPVLEVEVGEECQPLPIPASLSPYIKYGVLSDLLMKEGEANDPERAAYCEERFSEGVDVSRAVFGLESA